MIADLFSPDCITRGATFARNDRLRLTLTRSWCGGNRVCFIGLKEITSGPEPWPDLHALRLSPSGHPMHPMARGRNRLPDDLEPVLWRRGSA